MKSCKISVNCKRTNNFILLTSVSYGGVNDGFWGKVFIEWTNAAKAKPLFKGHYQSQILADLGLYDLRSPEVRLVQAELAKEKDVEGFCYWYFGFGNGEKSFRNVV